MPFQDQKTNNNNTSRMSLSAVIFTEDDGDNNVREQKYKGRIRIWPGALLLFIIIASSLILITVFAIHTLDRQSQIAKDQYAKISAKRRINDGSTTKIVITENGTTIIETVEEEPGVLEVIEDLVDEESGEIGNPSVYPESTCKLPSYTSRNGKIYSNDIPIYIKGINWFGMETGHAIPYGLWDNFQNGTTVYEIASFLARNKFNSVRLPLSITSILSNKKPDLGFINTESNRAIPTSSYLGMLSGVIKALGFRKITVLLSMHTLTPTEIGELWYNDATVPEKDVLDAMDIITQELCNSDTWNVIGVDLKNEPHGASWGSGPATSDFREGAKTLGERMLKGCPSWLAFVEGVNSEHDITFSADGTSLQYGDWWGGGLQNVRDSPLSLSVPNKIVWAPHYYSPSVYPQAYMFGKSDDSRRSSSGAIQNYVELSDEILANRVEETAYDMFGYLASEGTASIVLGEYGGMYGSDRHPEKTNQRVIDYTMDLMLKDGYGGGYMWSLNPEGAYEFNPADKIGFFQEGLLTLDWLGVNLDYLKLMRRLDDHPDLQKFPCHE